ENHCLSCYLAPPPASPLQERALLVHRHQCGHRGSDLAHLARSGDCRYLGNGQEPARRSTAGVTPNHATTLLLPDEPGAHLREPEQTRSTRHGLIRTHQLADESRPVVHRQSVCPRRAAPRTPAREALARAEIPLPIRDGEISHRKPSP